MRLGFLLLLSCTTQKVVCDPGETQVCVCAAGDAGAQVCGGDGTHWETCACADGTAGDDAGDEEPPEDSGGSSEEDGDPTAGQSVYTSHCASCHGANGRGTAAGPDLSEEVPEKSDAELAEVITEGEDDMPAISLSAQELADVIAWLRQRFGQEGGQGEDDD